MGYNNMPVKIEDILSDPEFKSASPEDQKKVLTAFDPEFGGLDLKQISQFTGRETLPKADNIEALEQSLRGGLDVPLSREEAAKIARRRLIEREKLLTGRSDLALIDEGTPQERVGVLGQGPLSKGAALVYGAGQPLTFGVAGATLRLTEDALEKIGLMTPEERKALGIETLEEAPMQRVAGETLGAAVPTRAFTGLVKPGAGFVRRVLSGGTAAGTQGAIMGATEAIKEKGVDVSPSEIAERAIGGGAVGGLIGGTPPVAGAILRAPLKMVASLNKVFNPTVLDDIKRAARIGVEKGENIDRIITDSTDAILESGKAEKITSLREYSNILKETLDRKSAQVNEALRKSGLETEIPVGDEIASSVDSLINRTPLLKNAELAIKELPALRTNYDDLQRSISFLKKKRAAIPRTLKDDLQQASEKIEVAQSRINVAGDDVQELRDLQKALGGKMTIEDLNNQIAEWNAELGSYFQRKATGQANPRANSYYKAIDDARYTLKEKLIKKVNELTGEDFKKMREQYGALIEMRSAIAKRIPVHERQAKLNLPQSLQLAEGVGRGLEQISEGEVAKGVLGAVARPTVAGMARKINDPDYLVARAFEEAKQGKLAPGALAQAIETLAYPDRKKLLEALQARITWQESVLKLIKISPETEERRNQIKEDLQKMKTAEELAKRLSERQNFQ